MAVIPAGERYVTIDEVYVHPGHRRQGVGGELVERLLAEAEAQGITRGLVYSATKDWPSVTGFYQQHGLKMWYVRDLTTKFRVTTQVSDDLSRL